MRGRRGDTGFTLLEVLIALAILGTAIVAAMQGFAQGLRLLKLAGDHQEAVLLADQVVRDVIEPEEGQQEQTVGRFVWVRTTRIVDAPDLTPATGQRRGKVYEIAVTVKWDQSGQVDVATLRTVSVPVENEQNARAPGSSRDGSISTGASSSRSPGSVPSPSSSSSTGTSGGTGSSTSSSSRSTTRTAPR